MENNQNNEIVTHKDLTEVAGKLLAIKTIYQIAYDDFMRSGTEEGEWINNLLIDNLERVYRDIEQINKEQLKEIQSYNDT